MFFYPKTCLAIFVGFLFSATYPTPKIIKNKHANLDFPNNVDQNCKKQYKSYKLMDMKQQQQQQYTTWSLVLKCLDFGEREKF